MPAGGVPLRGSQSVPLVRQWQVTGCQRPHWLMWLVFFLVGVSVLTNMCLFSPPHPLSSLFPPVLSLLPPPLLSPSHSLPLLPSLLSSPSSTSWPCSRAPSTSHQATRASLVRSTDAPPSPGAAPPCVATLHQPSLGRPCDVQAWPTQVGHMWSRPAKHMWL